MIYGYEEPVAMPTMGVYDTSLMKAYIAGAKELYEQSQAEMKDYMKQYSDFYSPIAGDNEAYYNETIGRVNSLMLLMQENGIDPFKSPEARAAIQRLIYSTNSQKLNNIKASALNYNEYIKNRAILQSKGLWDPELDRLLTGGAIERWNTDRDGIFSYTSPIESKSLLSIIAPAYLKYAAKEYLRQNEKRGKLSEYYSIKGVTLENQDRAANAALDLLNNSSIYGQLYKARAQRDADEWNATHPDETPRTMEQQLDMNIREAASQFLQEEEEYNSTMHKADLDMAQQKLLYINYGQNKDTDSSGSVSGTYDYALTQFQQGISKVFGTDSARFEQYKPYYALNFETVQKDKLKNIGSNQKKFIDQFACDSPDGTYESFRGLSKSDDRKYLLTDVEKEKVVSIRHLMNKANGTNNLYEFGQFSGTDVSLGNYSLGYMVSPLKKQVSILEKDGRVHMYDLVTIEGVTKIDNEGNISETKKLGTYAQPTGVVSTKLESGQFDVDLTQSNAAMFLSQMVNKTIGNTTVHGGNMYTPSLIPFVINL